MSLFLTTIVSTLAGHLVTGSSLVFGDSPYDFQIVLERDISDTLRVNGVYGPDSTDVRPWISVHHCGDLNLRGLGTLELHNDDIYTVIDVSDMVEPTGGLRGVCIGYQTALARSVESLVYINSVVGIESFIFRPSNVSTLAVDNAIGYIDVQGNDFVYGVATFDGVVDSSANNYTLSAVRIDPADNALSTVSIDMFRTLAIPIEAAGGARISFDGQPLVHFNEGSNCLEILVQILPNLHYIFSNEAHSFVGGAEIVFSPEDYISQSYRPNVCSMKIAPATSPEGGLRISGTLARRLGGIHFDYENHRIGVFDPIV